jgi:hypothetical protein
MLGGAGDYRVYYGGTRKGVWGEGGRIAPSYAIYFRAESSECCGGLNCYYLSNLRNRSHNLILDTHLQRAHQFPQKSRAVFCYIVLVPIHLDHVMI